VLELGVDITARIFGDEIRWVFKKNLSSESSYIINKWKMENNPVYYEHSTCEDGYSQSFSGVLSYEPIEESLCF